MAATDALYFSGTKWLTVKKIGRLFPGAPLHFSVANGRAWKATEPGGEWRSFAELKLTDPGDIKRWLARFGSVDDEEHTAGWARLQKILHMFAGSPWSPPDAEGNSRRHPKINAGKILTISPDFLRKIDYPVGLEPFYDGRRLALRAPTHASFMLTSACLAMWTRHPPIMRLCDFCGFWFIRGRVDQRFCNRNCKTQASRRDTDVIGS